MSNISQLSMTFVDGSTVINAEKMNGIVSKINELVTAVNGGVTPATVSAPTISINNGVVSMACATAGATIKYTTNGSTPSSSNGTTYSGAFTPASGTSQIKAVAIKDGVSSSVTTQSYTPATSVTAPTIYIRDLAIIMSADSGSTIYYTLDGSTPTSASTQYTGAFTNSSNCTVMAVAIKNGSSSSVSTASFVAPQTTEARAPMIVVEGNQARILTNGVGTARYALDYNHTNDSMDNVTTTAYSEPITLSGDTTIIAKIGSSGTDFAILQYKASDGVNCILCSQFNDARFQNTRIVRAGCSNTNMQFNTSTSNVNVSFWGIQQGRKYRFAVKAVTQSYAYWGYVGSLPAEIRGELNLTGKYPDGQDIPAADTSLIPFEITAENYAYIATCWQGTTLTPFTEIIK